MKKNLPQDQQEIVTEQERRKMFLQYVNRSWLILGIVTLVTSPFFPEQRTQFYFFLALTFPTYLIIRFLNNSGRTWLAGAVFSLVVNFGFYSLFLILVVKLGPYKAFDTQATIWMLMGLAVLFAGAFVDKWAAPMVALFNTILLVATRLTLAPGSEPRPSVLVFWWMLALTIWLYEGTLNRALGRAWAELGGRRKAEKEAEESRNFLQQVVDTSPSMIFVVDRQGNTVFVNRYTAQYYGTTSEQLIAKSMEDIHSQEGEAHGFVSNDQEVIRTHARIVKDELNTAPNGEKHWFHTVKVPLLRSDGTVDALGISIDITERKRAEEALRESEKNLKRAQRIAHVGHWTWDMQTNRVTWSDEMYSIFGLDRESFSGDVNEIIQRTTYAEDMGRVLSAFEQAVQGQNPVGIEYRIIRPEGAIRHAWAEPGDQVTDASGKILKLSGIVQDITERKQAEEALRFTQFAIDHSADSTIWLTKETSQVIYVNDAACNMLGYSREELLSLTAFDIDPNVPLADWQRNFEILKNQGSIQFESAYKTKSGEMIPVEVTANYVEFAGQIYNCAFIRDITERKQAEETLIESEERFRSLSEAAFEGIMIHDQGVILNANQAFADLFSYRSPEDLIWKDGLDALPFAPESRELIRGNLSSGLTEPLEIRVMRPDGSMFPAETQGRDITINGRKLRVIAMRDITQRKQAEEEITRLFEESQRRLNQVEALHSIDLTISASMDLRMTLNILLKHVESLLDVDAADILLLIPNSHQFKFSAGRGFHTDGLERASVRLGTSFARRAVLERKTVVVSGGLVSQADQEFSKIYEREGFFAYTGVPLIAKGQTKGVLEVYHRSVHKSETEWLNLLETLAGRAAIAIDNTQLFNDLQQSNFELTLAYDATIAGWSRAMDLRDKETEGHTQRVTDLTLKLARAMSISESQLTHIRHGALLHDIGKMGVPDNILLKADQLTDEEWEKMRKHPAFAYDMLSSIRYLQPALDIPYCHHEKWDGTGYPRGLKGEEIPITARIFAVADVWDAITSDRPYRKGWSKEEALEYIKEQSGKYFDPQVVEEFLSLISDTSIQT
jgi:PAS domain S-box-containing protein